MDNFKDLHLNIFHAAMELFHAFPVISVLIFLMLNIIFASFFLPCSFFAVMAGALWGPYGFIVSTLGTLLANICTFTTSRVFFSKRSSTFLKKHLPNLSHYVRVLERHDWKFVAAIQLNPIVPAASMGYLVGLCTISLKRYVFLSFLFTLPLNLILNVTGITAVESVKNTEFIALLGLCVLVILMISLIGPSISNKIMENKKDRN